MSCWDMPDMLEDMVAVRPSCGIERAACISAEDEVIVCERPGGGAAPKMLEKAASRWLFWGWPYPRRWS
jgi:hypothetical protein